MLRFFVLRCKYCCPHSSAYLVRKLLRAPGNTVLGHRVAMPVSSRLNAFTAAAIPPVVIRPSILSLGVFLSCNTG